MTNREAFEKYFGNKLIYDKYKSEIHFAFGTAIYESEFTQTMYWGWQACSQHYEARIKELEALVLKKDTALIACEHVCDFTGIPAIEKAVKQALKESET